MRIFGRRTVSLLLALCLSVALCSPLSVWAVGTAAVNSFAPVDGETALNDPISTHEYDIAISGDYNGTDYLYLLYKGSTMLVYNMETKELADWVTTSDSAYTHSTPFGACIDGNGNLWVCGAGTYLYKYNPATKTGTQYSFSKASFGDASTNAYGITYAEETGLLYFSYNGYLAQCDPDTGKVTVLTSQLYSNTSYLGYGGIVYNNGCLYAGVNGTYDQIIKYTISEKTCTTVYTASSNSNTSYGIPYLSYVDGMLIGGYSSASPETCVISISGSSVPSALQSVHVVGRVSGEINGKVYFKNSGSLYAYNTATNALTRLGTCDVSLQCIDGVVTMGGNTSILAPKNNTSTLTLDLVVYTPSAASVSTSTISQFTGDKGTGMNLRALIADPTGRYLYAGAYGINKIAVYDLQTKQAKIISGYGHQTDSLFWYEDYLYVGNYNTGAITQIDPETGALTHFFDLMETEVQQKRMFALTAGDRKVFCGTVPDTDLVGGALVWYELDTGRTYVATGPNPQDVYYANIKVDSDTNLDTAYTWYNAATNTAATLPSAGNFTGVIQNQCINTIVYKDGYIYGTTTTANGQGVDLSYSGENAKLFVYDVDNRKVVGTCDVSNRLSNVIDTEFSIVSWIDAFAADPWENGKFWGVVSDTLFSVDITVSGGVASFNVKSEIAQSAKADYKHSSSYWSARTIVFDGDYLYVSFGNKGTYMVNTQNTAEYYKLSDTVISEMTLGADGNLYYFTNILPGNYDQHDIMYFPVSQFTQPMVAASVQKVIDALDLQMPDEKAIAVARAMYNALNPGAKALVNTNNLDAAENGFTVLLSKGDSKVYYADIAEALDAATAGATVSLNANVQTDKDLVLQGDIMLDLNGFALTAKSLYGFPTSQVIDSSENATGLLDATLEALSVSNPQLPLYDSEKGGYRFFDCSMKALGVREGNNDNAQFWFRMEFANPEAYELLKRGDSGMAIGGSLLVGEEQEFTIQFQNSTVTLYGQKEVNAANGQIAGIYLNVTSISAADDESIVLIPSATSGGVTVTVSDEDIELLTRKAELKWEEGSGFWN